MNNFANFLEKMKTESNSAIVESLQIGYNSLFEASLVATDEEEKELSNGFINKIKEVVLSRSRADLTPPDKLFPTLDGLTLKVYRAILNNPKTPPGNKDVFQRMVNRLENKYRRNGVSVPVDGMD